MTQLPGVAERAHLFGLPGGVLCLAVFHVALGRVLTCQLEPNLMP